MLLAESEFSVAFFNEVINKTIAAREDSLENIRYILSLGKDSKPIEFNSEIDSTLIKLNMVLLIKSWVNLMKSKKVVFLGILLLSLTAIILGYEFTQGNNIPKVGFRQVTTLKVMKWV